MIVAVVAGLVLGIASKLTDYVAPAWVGNSSAVWVLVAFLVGLRARDVSTGAWRGAVSLGVATASYYALRVFVIENVSNRFALKAFLFWMALALPSGAISGGAAARKDATLWSLPAGAFAGEVALVLVAGGRALHAAVAACFACALGVRTRWTARAVAFAVASGATVVAAGVAYRSLVLTG